MNSTKLLPWVLVGSVALNVFLAVSTAPQFWKDPPLPPPPPERMLTEMAETLPAADAVVLRQAMEGYRAELDAENAGPGQFHERMKQILLAEPFDAQAFKALGEEFQAKRERGGRAIGEILAEALPKMSMAGRKAIAEFRPPRPPR